MPLEILKILNLFSRPRLPVKAAGALKGYEPGSVLRTIRQLVRLNLLLRWEVGRTRPSRLKLWKGNVASAYYHLASRDVVFLKSPSAIDSFLRARLASERRPPPFKRYRVAIRLALSSARGGAKVEPLEGLLRERRTVREFSRRPVEIDDLAAIVRGTWGRTGWLDGGIIGPLVAKSSPSAGGLHPVESYVMAWNVRGLRPGLYHYDVAGDELRRLRSGDYRAHAVRSASGQSWVGKAAFLCVMTAVFERTLWKYEYENAYRVLWLDAGHLCQTFALLATAYGLGPFQTAAIQDSYIEKLIGLDGIKEFPVYLCGAGVPKVPLTETSKRVPRPFLR